MYYYLIYRNGVVVGGLASRTPSHPYGGQEVTEQEYKSAGYPIQTVAAPEPTLEEHLVAAYREGVASA